ELPVQFKPELPVQFKPELPVQFRPESPVQFRPELPVQFRPEYPPTILLKTLHFELKNRGYTGAYNTLSDSLKRFQISIGKAARNKVILPSNLVF
ncbi:hypothetical protein HX089_17130, partial [Myroides odoratimimus]|nr:hypothetical protein [Myroides odoratimimus]